MRVLIVDDYEDTAASLAVLIDMLGHSAVFATEASDALRKAQTFRPDVALIDLNLGADDGRDLCRNLRALNASNDCKFVALTGLNPSEHDLPSGLFDVVEIKPIDLDRLCAVLGKDRVGGSEAA